MYLGNDDKGIRKLEALLEMGDEDIYWLAPEGTLHRCIKVVENDDEGVAELYLDDSHDPVDMTNCENHQFIRLSRVLHND